MSRIPVIITSKNQIKFSEITDCCVQCGNRTASTRVLDIITITNVLKKYADKGLNLLVPGAGLTRGLIYLAKQKPTFPFCLTCARKNFLSALNPLVATSAILGFILMSFGFYSMFGSDNLTYAGIGLLSGIGCLFVAMFTANKNKSEFPIAVFKEDKGSYYYVITPSHVQNYVISELESGSKRFKEGTHPFLEGLFY